MSHGQQGSPLDLGQILPLAVRVLTRKTFFAILVIGLLVTGLRAYRAKPIFRSETVLLYENRGGANPLSPRDAPSPRKLALDLQATLFSRAFLEKIITDLGLYADTIARFGMVPAVEQMQKQDLHFEGREGYTFRISFDSTSPETAQLVSGRTADLLIKANLDSRAQEIEETTRFLESEKLRVEKELHKNEGELALFVAKHPEVLDNESLRAGATAVDGPESASLGLEMQALQLRERLAQLQRRPTDTAHVQNASRPNEARLRAEAEYLAAQRELADKRVQFTEEHPDVKRAAARVASAKAGLRRVEESPPAPSLATQAAAGPSSSTSAPSAADSSEARIVQAQLELLEKQARTLRSYSRRPRTAITSDPATLGRLRAQYVELQRRTVESRDHHDLLENRQFQAEMRALFASQAKRGDLTVVDPAFKPVVPLRSPRKKLIVVGVAGSFFFAFAFGLVLVLRDDRLRGIADFRRFNLPKMLCEVPKAKRI